MEKRELTSETRKRIRDAVNVELRAAGLATLDEIESVLAQANAGNEPKSAEAGFLIGLTQLVHQPEPSEEELADLLSKIKNKLRYEFRGSITESFAKLKQQLPRRRGGGRKEVLAPKEKAEACDEVAKLIRNRAPLKVAFQRVAQRFTSRLGHNVSARSVQRAWQERKGEDDTSD